jgi:transcription elongation factor GreA
MPLTAARSKEGLELEMTSNETVYLTSEGRAKLADELKYLIEVRRPEIAIMIKDAKDAGDISENAGYDEAKEQQAFVEGRILHLEDLLKRAEVIHRPNGTDSIGLGSTVTVTEEGGPQERFQIVGSAEADPSRGRISNESPLGKGLMGRHTGDTTKVKTPDGETLLFTVVEIA